MMVMVVGFGGCCGGGDGFLRKDNTHRVYTEKIRIGGHTHGNHAHTFFTLQSKL